MRDAAVIEKRPPMRAEWKRFETFTVKLKGGRVLQVVSCRACERRAYSRNVAIVQLWKQVHEESCPAWRSESAIAS